MNEIERQRLRLLYSLGDFQLALSWTLAIFERPFEWNVLQKWAFARFLAAPRGRRDRVKIPSILKMSAKRALRAPQKWPKSSLVLASS
jgi:hypothetical protein